MTTQAIDKDTVDGFRDLFVSAFSKPTCYVAAPDFSPEHMALVDKVSHILTLYRIHPYLPVREVRYDVAEMSPIDVLERNRREIRRSDFVLAITDGRDLGTMVELGMSYILDVPLVLYWDDHQERPFNLMLSAPAVAALRGPDQLARYFKFMRQATNDGRPWALPVLPTDIDVF